jgi:cellulose synthase/poly-beta-1,6-N-acetylglucosamine synthase-like glycosyltransferase/peptidoglycan/xylan/chitin deacetylase (PgdA/CDA1 family)/spore germination protein YaaH
VNEKPVFYDVKGKRKRGVLGVGAALGLFTAVLLTIVVIGCFLLPFIPGLPGGKPVIMRSTHPPLINAHGDEMRQADLILSQRKAALEKEIGVAKRLHRPIPKADTAGPVVAAFYAPWEDPASFASFKDNASKLTHIMPVWLTLGNDGNALNFSNFNLENYPNNTQLEKIADDNGVNEFPVLNNQVEGVTNEASVAKLLDSPASQTALINQLVSWLLQNRCEGINIDFEDLKDPDYDKLPAFLKQLSATFLQHHLGTSVDLEVSRLPNHENTAKIAAAVDFVVLMDYDDNSEESADPGPIAPFQWFSGNIEQASKSIPPDKLVIGIGNYGYDWDTSSKGNVDSVDYQEAARLAQESRDDLAVSQRITFDPDDLNSTYNYDDENGHHHQVWMLDGPSAYNEFKFANEFGARGEALWELGSEDPSIWSFYSKSVTAMPSAKDALSTVTFPYEINSNDKPGEILQVPSNFDQSKAGHRTIKTDSDGFATSVTYDSYPTPIYVDRIGKDPKKPPFEVALTFDDGPDGTYTPQILDVLDHYKVPATFFVIGENAISHPGLVRKEYDKGDEIGNHTFTHPDIGNVSDERAKLEMDSTQRAIQSIIGRSTRLFRPPYNADVEPTTIDELKPVALATQLGYYTVAESVDPQDWSLQDPARNGGVRNRTPQEIAQIVMSQVKRHLGSIVLLHDGGGDRHMTVQALNILIPQLKADGFKFVTVSSLLNKTRDDVMPPLSGKDLLLLPFERIFFYSWYIIVTFLTLAFLLAIGLGIGRIFLVTPLAIVADRAARKSVPMLAPGQEPLVSVIIAAYNEEEVIVQTVESVLASNYQNIEVVVVDDGSRDRTFDFVKAEFAGDKHVLPLQQDNAGKAAALSLGMTRSHGEIFVYLDADTLLAADAIQKLVAHFGDPTVGAVAGNVKVGNRINTLTRLQALEYIASQNLDRKAYAYINAVTVVPGAIGAWRKEAVANAGGYTSDTLAEDMDLTWRVRFAGWKIDNESGAVAYTEAPDTLRSFFKQRFRWTFGTLQCLYKHRRAMGRNGLFGRAVLPALLIYQFGIQIIAPFVDLQLLYSVSVFSAAWATHSIMTQDWRPIADATQTMTYIGFMYGIFFLVEFISAWIAFRMDKEKKSLLWWLFLQRLVYRQVLYVVVWKSLWTAFQGVRTGWGKFERRGTVHLAAPLSTRGREEAKDFEEPAGKL